MPDKKKELTIAPVKASIARAVGALAIGAVALGAVAIGRLVIANMRIRSLQIEELEVVFDRHLRRGSRLEVADRVFPGGNSCVLALNVRGGRPRARGVG